VFVTADQNLRYQQNLSNRRIAIVELPFIRRAEIARFADMIRSAIRAAQPGGDLQCGWTPPPPESQVLAAAILKPVTPVGTTLPKDIAAKEAEIGQV
jgi:hypothetical protein